MCKRIAITFFALGVSVATTIVSTAQAQLADTGGYVDRPLTLPRGQLRVDTAPSDYGYMDFGRLNEGRGMRLLVRPGPETFYFGAGAALGVADDLEVGALLLPILMAPSGNFGNLETYIRYQFLHEAFQLGVQGTLQIPTDGEFGTGIGLPAIWSITEGIRMDTGVEFEFLTGPVRFNLDIPLALAFTVVDSFFLGPRTGVHIDDFNGAAFPLGIFMGGTIAEKVDITGSMNWPWLVYASPYYETFNPDVIEFTVGATLFIDVF